LTTFDGLKKGRKGFEECHDLKWKNTAKGLRFVRHFLRKKVGNGSCFFAANINIVKLLVVLRY